MTTLSRAQDGVVRALDSVGTTATLIVPSAVYDTEGTVTETPTSYSVKCTDLIDEAKRYSSLGTDVRVSGTFYLAAKGLAVRPTTGHRIVYQDRTFAVLAAFPYSVQGGVVAWRVDVGEVANG